jgi:ribosomal protein S18 acetylase RimI-like enzyme
MGPSSQLREITADDAQDVFDLVQLADIAEVGEPNTPMSEVLADANRPEVFAVGLDDPGGGLAAYSWCEYPDGHSKVYGDVTLRPGEDMDTAVVMLDWMRAKARELAPGLPIHAFADSGNRLKIKLYESADGELIRRFYRMGIVLDDDWSPAIPELGAGIEIRGVTDEESDLRAMHQVVDTAFLDHFGGEAETYEQWAKHTLTGATTDLSLWWLATVDGVPASGLYASENPGAGYVDTLGTLREYRGRGLGRALLLTSFAEFHRRGYRKVILGVDATSPTGALGLYESAGMSADHEGWRYEIPPL